MWKLNIIKEKKTTKEMKSFKKYNKASMEREHGKRREVQRINFGLSNI